MPNFQIKTIETWTILGAFLYLQTVLFMGDIAQADDKYNFTSRMKAIYCALVFSEYK